MKPLMKKIFVISILNLIAAILLILTRYVEGLEFLKGLGTGLIIVGMPAWIFFLVKLRNEEKKQEFNMKAKDERVKANFKKAATYGFFIQSWLLLAAAVVCYFLKIDLFLPVMLIIVLTIIFVKVYASRLNNIE